MRRKSASVTRLYLKTCAQTLAKKLYSLALRNSHRLKLLYSKRKTTRLRYSLKDNLKKRPSKPSQQPIG